MTPAKKTDSKEEGSSQWRIIDEKDLRCLCCVYLKEGKAAEDTVQEYL